MAETLRFLGFNVAIEKDAPKDKMKRMIAAFGDRLKETSDAIAFFYFSGHGMQVDGRNYMIPVDAEINDETDVEVDGIEAWSALTRMEYGQTKMNIVVLDACRNNPYEKRFKSPRDGIGLAPMRAPAGTLIAYATAPGDVADAGPKGGYGPFTEALANKLVDSSSEVLSLFNSVSTEVYENTEQRQRPYIESSTVPPLALAVPFLSWHSLPERGLNDKSDHLLQLLQPVIGDYYPFSLSVIKPFAIHDALIAGIIDAAVVTGPTSKVAATLDTGPAYLTAVRCRLLSVGSWLILRDQSWNQLSSSIQDDIKAACAEKG
jgi:hypothetical protein